MSEKSREQISALIDGEQETGSVFILSAISANDELRQTWSRYHLIGETLRGNLSEQYDPDFATRVSNAIEREAAYDAPRARANSYLKPMAGLAIAASVAFVAVLGVRQVGVMPGSSSATQVADNRTPSITATQEKPVVAASANTGVVHPDQYRSPVNASARLNRYLVNYNEYRTSAGVQGMLPYVRIVAHEAEE